MLMLSRCLLFAALITISFSVQAEGIRERAARAYNQQAANFSDELLVSKANSPNWSWAWITPQHVHNELLKRAKESQSRAMKLSALLLNSFEESRDMNGTYIQSLFLQVLSESAHNPAKIELNSIKLIADKIKNLKTLLRDDEDVRAIAEAREILNKRFIAAAGSSLFAAKDFERTYQFYQVLKHLKRQNDVLVVLSAEYTTTQPAILNHLFEIAEAQDFEKLVELYSSRESGLKIAPALSNMHKLNAQVTIDLVKSRVEKFDEEKDDLSIVIDEISFLKSHASKDVLAALMPKLLRLLEIAEKRKDMATQALILDSFSGAGVGGGNSSITGGSGSGASLTWGQISSGRGGDTKCSANANTALALYRKNLISGLEINYALKDIYASCDPRANKALVYGVIANICEEAKNKNDEEVLKSCYSDVLMPLFQWISKNKTQQNVEVAKEFAERLFKLLPSQTVAALKPSCQIRIAVSPIYDQREKMIEDGEVVIVKKTNAGVTIKNCRDVKSDSNYIIDRYAQHDYVSLKTQLNWVRMSGHSSCVREIIEHATFKNVTAYLNSKLEKIKAPTDTLKTDKGSATATPYKGDQKPAVVVDGPRGRYTNIYAETTIAIPGENSSDDACISYYYYGRGN